MPPARFKQAHDIAKHLADLGDISGMEATALYRITSVTKIISVLRMKYGWKIRREFRYDHTGKRYARYFLEGWVKP